MRLVTREPDAFSLCGDVCDRRFHRTPVIDPFKNTVMLRALSHHGVHSSRGDTFELEIAVA